MYSKYLKQFIGKEIMIQIAAGDDGLVIYPCQLDYIDEQVVAVSDTKKEKKYIFNTSDIQVIGFGQFELTHTKESKPASGYA